MISDAFRMRVQGKVPASPRRSWRRGVRQFRRNLRSLRPRPVYLSVCTWIDASEGARLPGWIEYHRSAGVEAFFLYGTEALPGLIQDLDDRSYSVRIEANVWKGPRDRAAINRHACRQFARTTRWIAYLDPGEYLRPTTGIGISRVLTRYEGYAGLVLRAPGICALDKESPGDEETDLPEEQGRGRPDRYRFIVDPACVSRICEGGKFRMKGGRQCVSEAGTILADLWTEKPERGLLEIRKGDGPECRPGSREFRAAAWARALRLASLELRAYRPRRYYLSACLFFKNAAPYLAEWLEFHRLVGVEHFYLYNHGSSDNFAEVLDPYVTSGLVTLNAWSPELRQSECYEHCIREYGHESRWLMVIDDDEFFFTSKDTSVAEALCDYEKFAGVSARWLMYGTSGHQVTPPGLVIENFTRRQQGIHDLTKSVIDPSRVLRVLDPHRFRFEGGRVCVTERGIEIPHGQSRNRSIETFRVNHYYTKSCEEALRKVNSRGFNPNPRERPGEHAQNYLEATRNETLNEFEDLTIQRYLPELRRALQVPGRR